MSRKEDRHTVEDRLMFMKLLEEGYSIKYINKTYGICKEDLNVLWIKYQRDGIAGLEYKRQICADGKFREMVVRDIKDNCLPLFAAAAKYDVSVTQIKTWNRAVREKGYQALYEYKPKGRPPKARVDGNRIEEIEGCALPQRLLEYLRITEPPGRTYHSRR